MRFTPVRLFSGQQERDLGTDLIFGTGILGSDHVIVGAELFVKRKLSNPEDLTHGSSQRQENIVQLD